MVAVSPFAVDSPIALTILLPSSHERFSHRLHIGKPGDAANAVEDVATGRKSLSAPEFHPFTKAALDAVTAASGDAEDNEDGSLFSDGAVAAVVTGKPVIGPASEPGVEIRTAGVARDKSPREPPPTTSTNSKAFSTNSSATTTTTAPTAHSNVQPPPPPTTGSPKQPPNTTAPTSTSESATTASTKQAPSPSATTADYTTSASAEPTNTPP